MEQQYSAHGIRFRYPDSWEFTEESFEDSLTITVNSDSTVYWSVTVFLTRPSVEQVLETALEAFQEEYPELELHDDNRAVGPYPAEGLELNFVCLDLINSASIRAFRSTRTTLLVMYQGLDQEVDELQGLLDEISDSLICDVGDELRLD